MHDPPNRQEECDHVDHPAMAEPPQGRDCAMKEESQVDSAASFTAFLDGDARRLRRALCARFGIDIGVEVTQDALVYAWEHWDRLEVMENPVGYLYRVGQSSARAYRRHRRNLHFPVEPAGDVPHVEPGLEAALKYLTDRQRVAVLLVHAFGYRYGEAAEVMGVSTDAVRNHVHRGLVRLRRYLHIPPEE